MDPDPDRAPVARFLRSKDERAFRDLYRRHTPFLYLLALRLLGGDTADAEEAVQDSWIRATAGLSAFRWTSSLRTWLSGTLVNCCRERLRGRGRQERAAGAWLEQAPRGRKAWSPAALDLERAIAALPDGCREVLVLHDGYGHTHEEVGALLHIEAGTSKSQLHHARRRLEHALGTTARS